MDDVDPKNEASDRIHSRRLAPTNPVGFWLLSTVAGAFIAWPTETLLASSEPHVSPYGGLLVGAAAGALIGGMFVISTMRAGFSRALLIEGLLVATGLGLLMTKQFAETNQRTYSTAEIEDAERLNAEQKAELDEELIRRMDSKPGSFAVSFHARVTAIQPLGEVRRHVTSIGVDPLWLVRIDASPVDYRYGQDPKLFEPGFTALAIHSPAMLFTDESPVGTTYHFTLIGKIENEQLTYSDVLVVRDIPEHLRRKPQTFFHY